MLKLQSADAFSGLETAEALNSAQIDQRARTLRGQLTLDEKISLMHGQRVDRRRSDPLSNPGVRFSDGPRGVVMGGATTLPVSKARGATTSGFATEGRARSPPLLQVVP